ncbi:MAG: RNA polymerase factor sigma-54 [Deltaproteobacteria bacterium]|nr:RNA polymerase factor sigma-54 [Deltaproteobacteria bacterium]
MSLDFKQGLRLQQKQTLQLQITPQLQQALKLLQLNHVELVEEIQRELMENPTLEEVPGQTTREVPETAIPSQTAEARDSHEQQNGSQSNEVDWNQVLENMSDQGFRSERGASGFDELPPIETNLTAGDSLGPHLEWQLQMQSCTDKERAAALLIIRNLDDRGWLPVSLAEIVEENNESAETDEERIDLEDAEGALILVQSLDPVGCGASDLVDCLVVQARFHFPEDPYFPQVIQNHLGDIEKRNYAAIARSIDIAEEDVIEYHRMLKQLEPWPARNFTGQEPQYISPDVYVFKIGDEWQVVQNEDGMPKLRVSRYYRHVLQGKDSTREERDYIKERLSSADFLLKSIWRRQDTIAKVMRSILSRQRNFFDLGPDHLRPMVLKDVADEVGVHESTVSRVTSNKYVQCPQGLYELKYFFNNGVNAVHGEQVAAEAVKRRIKKLIAAEDPGAPLSDDQVVALLKRDNVDIARRTVAKYREAMGILPSSKRKNLC